MKSYIVNIEWQQKIDKIIGVIVLCGVMNNDNPDVDTIFNRLGMSRSDAQTYLALLEQGSVSIRKLAETTGINRGTTYESLKRLTTFGLVSARRQGDRERYVAEAPDKLFSIIREKRKELLEVDTAAKLLVPHLIAHQKSSAGRPLVRYYEDDEGIVTILKDVLQTCSRLSKKEYRAYSSSPIRHYLYRRFPQFTARRITEGIYVNVIAVGKGGEITEYSERKWLDSPDDSITSSYTIIYANKIATISIAADDTPYGVVIEDAGAASLQRLLFDQLWNRL